MPQPGFPQPRGLIATGRNSPVQTAPIQPAIGLGVPSRLRSAPFLLYLRAGQKFGEPRGETFADCRCDWGEIIVRTLGFFAAYTKRSNAPQLILRRLAHAGNGSAVGAGIVGFGVGAIVGSALTPQTVYVAPPPPVYYAPPPPVYVAPAPVYVGPV